MPISGKPEIGAAYPPSESTMANVLVGYGASRLTHPTRNRLNPHLGRHLVELRRQRIGQRDAVAQALGAALPPPLARQPDGVESRQALGGVQVAHVAIDLGREGV